jgi:hypothetical protein
VDTNVIRKITIQSQAVGATDTANQLNAIAGAQGKVVTASSAYDDALQKQQRSLALASQQYAAMASAQSSVALAITQQSQSLNAAVAANDNYAQSTSHVGDALRLATKTVIDHTASFLETAGAVGAGVLVFGSLLAVLGPIILTYKLVKGAIDLVSEAWDLGTEAIKNYIDIANKAAALDLSTTFFQQITKGAKDAGLSVDDVTKSFTTLQKQSADTLGGSPIQTRVDASVKAGNFDDNPGVSQLAQANSTQEKYQAVVTLIHQAMTDGQRLAAIDIAGTAFGPEAADNLRKDSGYFDKLNAAAAKIKDTEIVSPDDVGRALAIQNTYDAAVTILEQRWHPIQDLLTAGGIRMHEIWVNIVADIANAVDGAAKLIEQLGKAPSWFQDKLNQVGSAIVAATTTPDSRAAAEQSYGISSNPADIAATAAANSYTDALTRLGAGLKNVNAVQQAVSQTNSVQNAVWKDASHAIDTASQSQNDFVDRAINTLQKHVLQQQADTQAVGLGDAALASFRATAAETAAVQANGGEETAKQAAQFVILKQAAADAADALARANVANSIKFNANTALLSPTDAQIASQLKGIYPDVTTALNSAEAAQIRFNDATKELSSGIQSDLVSGLTDFTTGAKSAGQAFSDMGTAVLKTLDQMVIKYAVINPLAQALQTSLGGGGLLSAFGIGGNTGDDGVNLGSAAAPLPGLTASDYGFASGGYTGSGGKFEPAGIVHRGEYVMDADTTSRIGVAALNSLRGYAGGGLVTPPSRGPMSAASSPQFNVVVNNNGSDSATVSQKKNGSGGIDFEVLIGSAAAKQAAKPGSALSQVLDQRNRITAR